MIILACGNRDLDWSDQERIKAVFTEYPKGPQTTLLHGGCRGADRLAAEAAQFCGWRIREYAADWKHFGRAAGPMRNQKMLDEGKPDLVIAFFRRLSGGTFDMVERARKAELPIRLVECP